MNNKSKVLSLLENSKGEFLSGQGIADMLNISRAGVWKIIENLRREGYSILSDRKGYSLEGENNILSKEGILANLPLNLQDMEIFYFDEIDSTNNEAKRSGSIHNSLYISPKQISGRGRFGRTFESPKGIYFSLFYKMDLLEFSDILTIRAVLAVVRGLKEANLNPEVKWVNDVFLGGKKVCGILTEATMNMESGTISDVIIGIGLNIGTELEDFSGEVSKIAGVISKDINKNLLVGNILKEMDILLKTPTRDVINEYRDYLFILEKKVTYTTDGEEKEGRVLDIDDEGALIVLEDGNIRKLNSGEISIKI